MITEKNIFNKMVAFYKSNADRYLVSSSIRLDSKIFDSIEDAVNFAIQNLDSKSEINENTGEIFNPNPRDCESPMTIYNDSDHPDTFVEWYKAVEMNRMNGLMETAAERDRLKKINAELLEAAIGVLKAFDRDTEDYLSKDEATALLILKTKVAKAVGKGGK